MNQKLKPLNHKQSPNVMLSKPLSNVSLTLSRCQKYTRKKYQLKNRISSDSNQQREKKHYREKSAVAFSLNKNTHENAKNIH
jgi:hypothetical protein